MANDIIPFFGLARQYHTIREELLDAIDTVYSSGRMLDGAFVAIYQNDVNSFNELYKKINDVYPDLNSMNGIAYGYEDLDRAQATTPLLFDRVSSIEANNEIKIVDFLKDVDNFFRIITDPT